MVKYTKYVNGRSRKSYSYSGNRFRFYKAISNYHHVKLSTSDIVEYSGSTIKFVANNGNFVPIETLLQGCPDFKTYRDLFVSFKVRSISVHAVPLCNVSDFVGGSAFLALLSDNENPNLTTCVDSDHSLVLNPNQFCSLYIKMGTPWASSNDSSLGFGRIGVASNGATTQGAMRWTIKFTFYVLYKTNC